MDDNQFRQLLDRFDLSWKGYRKVRQGVKKRIDRHIVKLGGRTFEAYLKIIESDPAILAETKNLMTVSISHFFRDHALWRALENEILPELIKCYRNSISVWCAGSALGQEVYSLKMLWQNLTFRGIPLPKLQITATDSNPDYLKRAKEGIFEKNALKGITENDINRHFQTFDNGENFRIADYLKKDINWIHHDMIGQSPPDKSFQIIFLRNNLLTYYRENLRKSTIVKIVESLDTGGFLIIGTHEKIPDLIPDLTSFKKYEYILKLCNKLRGISDCLVS